MFSNCKGLFNPFECSKKFLNKLDVMGEQACMATPKENNYFDVLNNQRARIAESK